MGDFEGSLHYAISRGVGLVLVLALLAVLIRWGRD